MIRRMMALGVLVGALLVFGSLPVFAECAGGHPTTADSPAPKPAPRPGPVTS